MVLGSIRRHYFATKILAFGRREAAKKNKIFEALVMCWISVNDQLPNPGEKVDVWIVSNGNHKQYQVISKRYPDAICVKLAGGIFFAASTFADPFEQCGFDVTHWRYPPAPPESANAAKGD